MIAQRSFLGFFLWRGNQDQTTGKDRCLYDTPTDAPTI
jgi:hypothetical protein